MQSQYQQLSYPQASVPFLVVPAGGVQAAAADEPNCCECSQCCAPPNCCSRLGSCPCFCNGHVGGFSVALASLWLALPVLVTAIAIPDFIDFSGWYYNGFLGAFSSCVWSGQWGWQQCDSGAQGLGNGVMFDAFRSFLIIGLFFLLASSILASIRLSCQQRSRPPSACMEWMTATTMLTAFATVSTAFVLSNTLVSSLDLVDGTGGSYGLSWVLLTVAEGLVVLGTVTHLITWRLWVKKTARQTAGGWEEQPGAGYGQQQAAFSHPAPLYYAAAAPPPTAMPQPAVMYPAAASFSSMSRPPMPVHIYSS